MTASNQPAIDQQFEESAIMMIFIAIAFVFIPAAFGLSLALRKPSEPQRIKPATPANCPPEPQSIAKAS